MIGILTEKQSAKAKFAKALGGIEGVYNGERYVIVNARGHMYQLKNPDLQVNESLQKKYKSWELTNLPWKHNDFKWVYQVSPGAQKQLKEIKDTLKNCKEIIVATDIDPSGEGDLLAAEILIGQGLNKKKLTRMEFVDESVKSLQKAFKERRSIPDLEKDPNYQKALFRSKWDFMSMQFTRIATNVSPIRGVIRQGRLKSTMVYLVGEQLKLSNAYEEIPYFQNRFIDENKIVYINNKEKKHDNEKSVPQVYKESKVIIDNKVTKSTPPPKLMDLARLSALLAPRGFSSKEVEAVYQKMYQEEILSYPRTEDKNVTLEQFSEMLPLIDDIAKLVKIDSAKLTCRKPRKTHVQDKGSHGANRPGLIVPKNLDSLKKFGRSAVPIYIMLAKNFLSMFCEDYVYEHQRGHIEDYPDFKGTANIPKSLGWKEVFLTDDDEKDENEQELGLGKKGKPFVYKGFPPKPSAPTQGWLMKQLEKHNVGSGSTRNSTFSEVTNQKSKCPLMIADKGRLSLTIYGIVSHQLLEGTKIGDVNITETVFNTMKEISEGNLKIANEKLDDIEKLIKHDLKVMKENSRNVLLPEYEQAEKEGFTDKDGEEIQFKKEWGGHKFTEEELGKLKAGDYVTINNLKNKRGKKYTAKGKLLEQSYKGSKFWGFKMTEYAEEGKNPISFD